MPCYDSTPTFEASALCAIVMVLEKRDLTKSVVAEVDWKRAGVTEERFWQWWRTHRMGDLHAGNL
jgi:hypothetical protein